MFNITQILTKAVHGDAARRDRQAGAQRNLARDVAAGGAFRGGAAHDHVVVSGR